ncbi:hypothetical protein CEXT_84991 [Caerostris extrusa]|uniref:Uncharacterized protein n=1 Tax=Caerostris extrusa TaxID=172846 RepID=A0AAV4TLV8_CAEEX|nr:hypothetical protein CEXT_84991 [Caerostris extrusa]
MRLSHRRWRLICIHIVVERRTLRLANFLSLGKTPKEQESVWPFLPLKIPGDFKGREDQNLVEDTEEGIVITAFQKKRTSRFNS